MGSETALMQRHRLRKHSRLALAARRFTRQRARHLLASLVRLERRTQPDPRATAGRTALSRGLAKRDPSEPKRIGNSANRSSVGRATKLRNGSSAARVYGCMHSASAGPGVLLQAAVSTSVLRLRLMFAPGQVTETSFSPGLQASSHRFAGPHVSRLSTCKPLDPGRPRGPAGPDDPV